MTDLALDKLLKQKQRLEARIKNLRSKVDTQARNEETRRKILVGAYVLQKYDLENKKEELIQELDQFLFRAGDRILFELAPRTEDSQEVPSCV